MGPCRCWHVRESKDMLCPNFVDTPYETATISCATAVAAVAIWKSQGNVQIFEKIKSAEEFTTLLEYIFYCNTIKVCFNIMFQRL